MMSLQYDQINNLKRNSHNLDIYKLKSDYNSAFDNKYYEFD